MSESLLWRVDKKMSDNIETASMFRPIIMGETIKPYKDWFVCFYPNTLQWFATNGIKEPAIITSHFNNGGPRRNNWYLEFETVEDLMHFVLIWD